MWIFGFSPRVCPTEPSNLMFSLRCLVSNGSQALLGGIRLGGSATWILITGTSSDVLDMSHLMKLRRTTAADKDQLPTVTFEARPRSLLASLAPS